MGEEGKEYVFFAVDGAKRMSSLIKDLLEYSRVGRKEATMQKTDLTMIFDSKLRDLSQKIKEKNAEVIQIDLPEELYCCLLYTSPSPRDATLSRMPSSA